MGRVSRWDVSVSLPLPLPCCDDAMCVDHQARGPALCMRTAACTVHRLVEGLGGLGAWSDQASSRLSSGLRRCRRRLSGCRSPPGVSKTMCSTARTCAISASNEAHSCSDLCTDRRHFHGHCESTLLITQSLRGAKRIHSNKSASINQQQAHA